VHRDTKNGPELLLIRPRAERDVWGLPKGLSEPGELATVTALRETLEETGLAVVIEDQLPDASYTTRAFSKTVHVFLAAPIEQDAEPRPADGENFAVAYFPIDTLPRVHPYQADTIAAAVRLIRTQHA
jgi:ADP-ribose pyrophosphatase YjhB (NUDIX family)